MWCVRVWCETWDFPEQITRQSESRSSFFLAVSALQCWPRRASRMPRQKSMHQCPYAAIHVTFVNPIHHSARKHIGSAHELCCPAYPNLTMTPRSLQTSQKKTQISEINKLKQLGQQVTSSETYESEACTAPTRHFRRRARNGQESQQFVRKKATETCKKQLTGCLWYVRLWSDVVNMCDCDVLHETSEGVSRNLYFW